MIQTPQKHGGPRHQGQFSECQLPQWLDEPLPHVPKQSAGYPLQKQPLTQQQLRDLATFQQLIGQWNRRTNLMTAKENLWDELMFADALALAAKADNSNESHGKLDNAEAPWVMPLGVSVVDVGAGGGVPGIPLAIIRPDLRLLLVEPRRKRVAFMRTAIGTLNLASRVCVLEGKLSPEDPRRDLPPVPFQALNQTTRAPFDIAYSRATFAPETWVGMGQKLASRTLVLLQGHFEPYADPPFAMSPGQQRAVGEAMEREKLLLSYLLPDSREKRSIVGVESCGSESF